MILGERLLLNFRDPKRNLLDVIASAYQCDDVIDFLKQVDVSKTYSSNEGWVKQIKSNRRVQERYVAAIAKILSY